MRPTMWFRPWRWAGVVLDWLCKVPDDPQDYQRGGWYLLGLVLDIVGAFVLLCQLLLYHVMAGLLGLWLMGSPAALPMMLVLQTMLFAIELGLEWGPQYWGFRWCMRRAGGIYYWWKKRQGGKDACHEA